MEGGIPRHGSPQCTLVDREERDGEHQSSPHHSHRQAAKWLPLAAPSSTYGLRSRDMNTPHDRRRELAWGFVYRIVPCYPGQRGGDRQNALRGYDAAWDVIEIPSPVRLSVKSTNEKSNYYTQAHF